MSLKISSVSGAMNVLSQSLYPLTRSQWTRVETELRLEPLNGRLTLIRVHKLEPCNEHDNERGSYKVGSEVWDRGRRKLKRDGIVSRFT